MGRPKGALNRRTLEFRERYEAEGYRDPLMFLGKVVSMDTADLARNFKCKRRDVLPLQIKAAVALAPYLHSQMPRRLKVDAEERRTLLVVGDIPEGSPRERALAEEGFSLVRGAGGAVVDVEPETVEELGLPAPEEKPEKSEG